MRKAIGGGLLLGILWLVGCQADVANRADQEQGRTPLRYYAYAPPLIPHEVLNRKCLDCHGKGLVVDGRKAPVTPHPELVNCMQCHIRADENIALFKANQFIGLHEPGKLALPQPSGPPLMPHRLFMRENCLVCHGDPTRTQITQTTHPERSNCLQCHVVQDTIFAQLRRSK